MARPKGSKNKRKYTRRTNIHELPPETHVRAQELCTVVKKELTAASPVVARIAISHLLTDLEMMNKIISTK